MSRASEVGTNDIHTRTHLGHLLKPGDVVLGFVLHAYYSVCVPYNKVSFFLLFLAMIWLTVMLTTSILKK